MLKWFIGVFIFLVVLVVIIQPEWLKFFGAVFSDFIQANEK
jgi:hypothetical protein